MYVHFSPVVNVSSPVKQDELSANSTQHLDPTAGHVKPGTLDDMVSKAGWHTRRAIGIKEQSSWRPQQSADGT
ncbi:hypothetical protein Baya_8229 [Bagarius yarrelli]|uniref:Uncharacterized protein n=1 Tax=Bagarius yarrelli TaxID=175774 RepID=A0A556U3K3_BAGYA|nr:hypothetical protein Baya_8229 [Bagarius yarrelli]